MGCLGSPGVVPPPSLHPLPACLCRAVNSLGSCARGPHSSSWRRVNVRCPPPTSGPLEKRAFG
eukprot:7416038-Pyramimonas_sp.AAC.1